MNRGIVRSIATVVFALTLAFAFSTGGLGCSGKRCCPSHTKQCQGACSKKTCDSKKCDKSCAKMAKKGCSKKCSKPCGKKSPKAKSIAGSK